MSKRTDSWTQGPDSGPQDHQIRTPGSDPRTHPRTLYPRIPGSRGYGVRNGVVYMYSNTRARARRANPSQMKNKSGKYWGKPRILAILGVFPDSGAMSLYIDIPRDCTHLTYDSTKYEYLDILCLWVDTPRKRGIFMHIRYVIWWPHLDGHSYIIWIPWYIHPRYMYLGV